MQVKIILILHIQRQNMHTDTDVGWWCFQYLHCQFIMSVWLLIYTLQSLTCAINRISVVNGELSICFSSVHGSSVSLVSTASSLYSTPEEKQSHEIRKLRRELQDAQEKVHTLTNQLSTNVCLPRTFYCEMCI